MVGVDGSIIVRVDGTLGPVAAHILTSKADDEGIEVAAILAGPGRTPRAKPWQST